MRFVELICWIFQLSTKTCIVNDEKKVAQEEGGDYVLYILDDRRGFYFEPAEGRTAWQDDR